jgi:NAD dependent epimerase/dehydratase family enzyme
VTLRISIVFGKGGGAFPVMRRFAKLGLGGRQGPGSQWMSWLHLDDWVGIIEWLLKNEQVSGTVNLAAPNPVTNAAFMREMRKRYAPLGIGFPAPSFAVRFGSFFLRTAPELVLKSRKVVSGVLADGGYAFQYPTIEKALDDLSAS